VQSPRPVQKDQRRPAPGDLHFGDGLARGRAVRATCAAEDSAPA
jgi:hypothetical protein